MADFQPNKSYKKFFRNSSFKDVAYKGGNISDFTNDIGYSQVDTGSLVTTSSFNEFTSSYTTGSFTGSFNGTFGGNIENAVTASYALTAQTLLGSVESASYSSTSSYALTAQTLLGSVVSAETASYVLPLNQDVTITGSLIVSGSGGRLNTALMGLWDSNNLLILRGDIRLLCDINGNESIHLNNRVLIDEASVNTISYTTTKRHLYDTAGSTVLNFATAGAATFDGTSSYATTASYALTAQTLLGSVVSAETASYILGSEVDGAVASATSATSAGSVTNAATFNNGGAGAASGTTFDGSVARTISYNTIGAPSTSGTNATGTWGIDITGNAATATNATTATTAATASYVQASNIDGVIQPRVTSIASSATPTPDADTTDMYIITALATGATFGSPTGTPVQGQKLMIRIEDNGSAQSLAYNAVYRAFGTALPTRTTIGKTLYLGCIYNSTDSAWDVVATAEQV